MTNLCRSNDIANKANQSMYKDIGPTSNLIVCRILPCLASITFQQIMCGFPVVVDLVTIIQKSEQA
jgi:hypothetical protein